MRCENNYNTRGGIGILGVIAGAISWGAHQSFWWMLLHSCFGVFYLIYAAFTGDFHDGIRYWFTIGKQ